MKSEKEKKVTAVIKLQGLIRKKIERNKNIFIKEDANEVVKEEENKEVEEENKEEENKEEENKEIKNIKVIGPAWIRGEIEAPTESKNMGSWIASVYSEEQQNRLNVDEFGEKQKVTKDLKSNDECYIKHKIEIENSNEKSNGKILKEEEWCTII